MLTVTLPTDEIAIGTALTIDMAIQFAKDLTKAPAHRKPEYEVVVIRDGDRIRARAKAGRAHWLKRCEACDGTGYNYPKSGPSVNCAIPCDYCEHTGLVEDGPC